MTRTAPSALAGEIRAIIARDGPITVERFMALALAHPTLGYYTTRDPFGASGDFVTAPETSQMFGELLGAWAATVWAATGSPRPVRLIELGPGRGTLISDALRAARRAPDFVDAISLHLVETSPVLREAQRRSLTGGGAAPTWHATIEDVPPGPALVIANEFFDALPIRQYVRTADGWRERLVGLRDEHLAFGIAPEPEPALEAPASQGAILELGLAARGIAAALAARLVREGGAALVIDYGYAGPRLGDTLQAVQRHRFVDPLDAPGEADLTAHVDLSALASAARHTGAEIHGPVTQGAFLRELGIEARAEALLRRASPVQAEAIAAALARLTGEGTPDRPGMGTLFKVMAFSAPGSAPLPGFASSASGTP